MPKIFVVPDGVVMEGERQVLDALAAGSVDLHREVILEQDPPRLDEPKLTLPGSDLEILDYQDDKVSLLVHTDGSGFLVLMDFLLPGWAATVDGRPEQILAGNFAGRALPIRSGGEHRIEFHYQPPVFRDGLIASISSLALLMLFTFFWRFLKRYYAPPRQHCIK